MLGTVMSQEVHSEQNRLCPQELNTARRGRYTCQVVVSAIKRKEK